MIHFEIKLDGDGCWPDIPQAEGGVLEGAAALAVGTQGGKPSLALRIRTRGGQHVIAETTLALFLAAAEAFKARYGDPRAPGWMPR